MGHSQRVLDVLAPSLHDGIEGRCGLGGIVLERLSCLLELCGLRAEIGLVGRIDDDFLLGDKFVVNLADFFRQNGRLGLADGPGDLVADAIACDLQIINARDVYLELIG